MICMKLHQTPPICRNLHQTELSCINLLQVAPICGKFHQSAPNCTKLHQSAHSFTKLHQSTESTSSCIFLCLLRKVIVIKFSFTISREMQYFVSVKFIFFSNFRKEKLILCPYRFSYSVSDPWSLQMLDFAFR